MDQKTRNSLHKELKENPLYLELVEFIIKTREQAQQDSMSRPPDSVNEGWFAAREQTIGAASALQELELFIQDELVLMKDGEEPD